MFVCVFVCSSSSPDSISSSFQSRGLRIRRLLLRQRRFPSTKGRGMVRVRFARTSRASLLQRRLVSGSYSYIGTFASTEIEFGLFRSRTDTTASGDCLRDSTNKPIKCSSFITPTFRSPLESRIISTLLPVNNRLFTLISQHVRISSPFSGLVATFRYDMEGVLMAMDVSDGQTLLIVCDHNRSPRAVFDGVRRIAKEIRSVSGNFPL